MKNTAKRLELASNIAILVVAALLSVVLVKNYLLSKTPLTPDIVVTNDRIQAGAKLSLPGVDWAQDEQTLVLALSTTCHFCTESAPFYQQLEKAREGNTRMIAIFPQSVSDGEDYLNRLGVSVDGVSQASLASINVRGTPTLMLVDGSGIIVNQWVGKLPDAQQREVLSKLRALHTSTYLRLATEIYRDERESND